MNVVVLKLRDNGHGGGLARGKVLSKSNVSISYQMIIMGLRVKRLRSEDL